MIAPSASTTAATSQKTSSTPAPRSCHDPDRRTPPPLGARPAPARMARRSRDGRDPPRLHLADLAPQAKAAGIGRTVLVQVLPSLAETAEFLALAGEQDLVAGVVGWADLTGAAVPRRSPGCARDLAAHA